MNYVERLLRIQFSVHFRLLPTGNHQCKALPPIQRRLTMEKEEFIFFDVTMRSLQWSGDLRISRLLLALLLLKSTATEMMGYNHQSPHYMCIVNQIIRPASPGIYRRLSEISSDEAVLKEAATPYQEVLYKGGCTYKVQTTSKST